MKIQLLMKLRKLLNYVVMQDQIVLAKKLILEKTPTFKGINKVFQWSIFTSRTFVTSATGNLAIGLMLGHRILN